MMSRAVILPVAIVYYGDCTEEEHEAQVELNQERLEAMGLSPIEDFKPGTDCHCVLFSDDSSLSLTGDLIVQIIDSEGRIWEEYEQESFDIWGEK